MTENLNYEDIPNRVTPEEAKKIYDDVTMEINEMTGCDFLTRDEEKEIEFYARTKYKGGQLETYLKTLKNKKIENKQKIAYGEGLYGTRAIEVRKRVNELNIKREKEYREQIARDKGSYRERLEELKHGEGAALEEMRKIINEEKDPNKRNKLIAENADIFTDRRYDS